MKCIFSVYCESQIDFLTYEEVYYFTTLCVPAFYHEW